VEIILEMHYFTIRETELQIAPLICETLFLSPTQPLTTFPTCIIPFFFHYTFYFTEAKKAKTSAPPRSWGWRIKQVSPTKGYGM